MKKATENETTNERERDGTNERMREMEAQTGSDRKSVNSKQAIFKTTIDTLRFERGRDQNYHYNNNDDDGDYYYCYYHSLVVTFID